MRILILTPTFLPALGGAELVVFHICRRLACNHSVLILTPHLQKKILENNGSADYDHLINFNVERYQDRYSLMKLRGHQLTSGLIPPFSLSAVAATRKAVGSFKPDVLNVHYVMPTGLAGFYAKKVLKIPTVITYNGRDVPGPGVPKLWKYWHRLIGRNCSEMTFVSKYCHNAIYNSDNTEGNVIYNGVENPRSVTNGQIVALKSKLQIEKDESVLFGLQRLDPLKRVDILIKSMELILRKKSKVRLIIGGKGEDMPQLKKLAEKLKISKYITFAGFIPDKEIPVYYAISDLCVFHSTYETFGMVLAEAMNYKKAIVSVSNTAISEIIDNGKTGLLVPTLNHKAFANAVLKLLSNEERRNKMGMQGYNKAQKLFKWDVIASQYEKVFELAINGEPIPK
jgi:glycosyltransferase involved in cell wall biosynthesis